ncbi:serine/threonine-protein kinase [Streptomyces sp. NBC_00557]|uniref:serine/threonine-protein kinase n=1 Tax=Streptomyces sp. NBC_00557 TaxID=2975776 RepID=UPI002E823117|nr:serine/threonine-protein kinase [Streptomyces sp. NBC_00557]WUC37965.1 serine/threonine protein kinase [Streptomyces sp. NBC_00557]
MSEEPGRERVIAGRYRLLSALGEGGMGTVWRARDEVLHREVAVKEVRAPAGLPASDVERMYARLEREAWAAARVANRNVVTVYDVAMEGGRPWIVMELVRGLSLADQLEAEGPLSPQRAAHVGAEVLSALRAAHAAGVLHRDVKPANVLLANDGRVVLTDFGIATVEGSSALTMTGEVIGSPEFLAPERALGRTPGPESDLWSLGVLLYAAVEGVSPFRYDTPLSTLRAVVDEELPPPRRAGPLAGVIEGLLRKDPAERIDAERAEHDLRIVAAGGAPSGGGTSTAATMPVPPYATPTVAAPHRQPSPTPPLPPPGTTAPTTATTSDEPQRNRRAGAVLVAGLLLVALALAGLTYVLLNRDNGGAQRNAGDGTRASGGARKPTAHGSTDSGTTAPPSARNSTSASTRPAQSVQVTVAGANTTYSGSCPPPDAQTPTFTATFTVGRLPAQVEYRWVTARGSVSDPGWHTLSFPEGGGKTRQVRVTLTVYRGGASSGDQVGVKVRAPVQTTSNLVPFSVDCTTASPTETPSGTASPSGSGSPESSP